MLLFPIMFLWIVGVAIWVIRNTIAEPDEPKTREWRRWRPSRPRRPRDGHGSSATARAGASRRRAEEPRRPDRRSLRP
jgi:hypothetical protein